MRPHTWLDVLRGIIILADEKNVTQRGGQNENLSYETILGELQYTPYFFIRTIFVRNKAEISQIYYFTIFN